MWRSLVSRLVRDQEAPGSNPGTPTIKMRRFTLFLCSTLTQIHAGSLTRPFHSHWKGRQHSLAVFHSLGQFPYAKGYHLNSSFKTVRHSRCQSRRKPLLPFSHTLFRSPLAQKRPMCNNNYRRPAQRLWRSRRHCLSWSTR